MKVNNIELTAQQVFGDNAILVSQTERSIYYEGKPTEQKKKIVTIVCPSNGFDKVDVKIDGNFIDIANDLLQVRNDRGNYIYVTFVNFKGKMYTDYRANETKISATADAVSITELEE